MMNLIIVAKIIASLTKKNKTSKERKKNMRIKYSKRGLTFSFKENDTFRAGVHYRYIIDAKASEVIIVPDENGKYVLSKKGSHQKPLVDLRNAEIKNIISMARYMEIEVMDNKIVVHIINKDVQVEGLCDRELVDMLDKSEKFTFEVPKETLIEHDSALIDMLTASGLFSAKMRNDISYVFDVASLFSGAGLLDYPFKQDESFNVKFAIDFDKAARETYRKNIGDHILCMDMRDLNASDVPDIDLVIGGPCCQGYSNSNRAGNEEQDAEKRLLIEDYIKVVKAKQPLMFVIENVPQFITKENGLYLEKVLTELSEYNITYSVVNDHEVGGYSTRKRTIVIGSMKNMGKIVIPNVELTKKRTAGDALRKVTSSWFNYNDVTQAKEDTRRKMSFVRPGHNYLDIPEMAHLDRHSNVYRRLSYDEPSVTITNWRKVNLMPPEGNRILSVAEAAAIMGLDEKFKFYGSLDDKQQQVGNGVTQHIARFVKTIVKNALYKYANDMLFAEATLPVAI